MKAGRKTHHPHAAGRELVGAGQLSAAPFKLSRQKDRLKLVPDMLLRYSNECSTIRYTWNGNM